MLKENNKSEYIILVDEKGARLGTEEKEKCHEGKGLLHSAFLVIILNEEFEILLTRRSRLKKLWPGYWDGSVASHFSDRLHPMDKIKERIQQEIGVNRTQFKYLAKFFSPAWSWRLPGFQAIFTLLFSMVAIVPLP